MSARVGLILFSSTLLNAACSTAQPEQREPTQSCESDIGTTGASWGHAAGLNERAGFEQILQSDCGISNSEPSTFSSFDQLDGSRTIGVHLQTFCLPFEVAIKEDDEYVSVSVRTTVVDDLFTICGGNINQRLGTYLITLADDLGDRRVLPV